MWRAASRRELTVAPLGIILAFFGVVVSVGLMVVVYKIISRLK